MIVIVYVGSSCWIKEQYSSLQELCSIHCIMSTSLLKQQFDCSLRVSGSLVLQADQGLLLPRVKTADVTRQPGRSGSSSPRAPDRPAEPHDGWALSISWLHLWPAADYSWRLLYSLLSSALHAPLTPHSLRGLLELSHHSTKGKTTVGHKKRREEKLGVEKDFFFFPASSFILSPARQWHCQKMKEHFFGLLQPSLSHRHYANLQHLFRYNI